MIMSAMSDRGGVPVPGRGDGAEPAPRASTVQFGGPLAPRAAAAAAGRPPGRAAGPARQTPQAPQAVGPHHPRSSLRGPGRAGAAGDRQGTPGLWPPAGAGLAFHSPVFQLATGPAAALPPLPVAHCRRTRTPRRSSRVPPGAGNLPSPSARSCRPRGTGGPRRSSAAHGGPRGCFPRIAQNRQASAFPRLTEEPAAPGCSPSGPPGGG